MRKLVYVVGKKTFDTLDRAKLERDYLGLPIQEKLIPIENKMAHTYDVPAIEKIR